MVFGVSRELELMAHNKVTNRSPIFNKYLADEQDCNFIRPPSFYTKYR
jgi:hypothetical protein